MFNKNLHVEPQLPWEAQIMKDRNTAGVKFKCSKGQGFLCLVLELWNSLVKKPGVRFFFFFFKVVKM